ncbi:MAG: glycosyltransferase [Bacteroidaceae bacterium]|nr:glycosyltransferase [Bacteroidaceae bacterium]
MTAILVLNWNGVDDTIACLQSLARAEGEFSVFVIDNGSTNNSVELIQSWIDGQDELDASVIALDKNYGFARGNNEGLLAIRDRKFDSYLLLNNDTEVMPDFLVRLTEFSARNPKYRVLTPKINYFFNKNMVWNCGGRCFLGFRKYFYAGQTDDVVAKVEKLDITYVTGCALFFYPELLGTDGRLLTERFFFGEEDFEFSIRMKQRGVKMACVMDSLIYHKVNASITNLSNVGKLYNHFLNRYIDVRQKYSVWSNICWKLLNYPILLYHFFNKTHSWRETFAKSHRLMRDAKVKETVTYEDFRRLVIEGTYFN